MELNLKEVKNLWHELYGYATTKEGKKEIITHGLLHQKMSMKVKLYVNRLGKVVNDEMETLEITGEDVKLFQNEMEELLTAKKKIDVSSLWSTDLSINDLASIETEENYPIFYRLVDNKD